MEVAWRAVHTGHAQREGGGVEQEGRRVWGGGGLKACRSGDPELQGEEKEQEAQGGRALGRVT